MSDPNKYINTYVDFALGTVHDYLNQLLQVKTQLKIANDLVAEKDQVISAYEDEKQRHNDNMSLVEQANANAKRWEDEVTSMRNKITHMETLSNQCVEMKRALQEKNVEIDNLNKELQVYKEQENKKLQRIAKKEEKKTPIGPSKKDINKEMPRSNSVITVNAVEETDDF